RRDPFLDVRGDAWVAVDFGASSLVVAVGDGERHELIRIGASRPPKTPRDFEMPNMVQFQNLPRVIKGWQDRVILPLTEWGDVYVGRGAGDRLEIHGKERSQRMKCTVAELGTLPARHERGEKVAICGRSDPDAVITLEPPAPPIVDEEGIDPDDPFDPIELLA